jgi:hypothetical protein
MISGIAARTKQKAAIEMTAVEASAFPSVFKEPVEVML